MARAQRRSKKQKHQKHPKKNEPKKNFGFSRSEKKPNRDFEKKKQGQRNSFRRDTNNNDSNANGTIRRLKAVVDKNPKGFAFLVLDEKKSKDIFIGAELAQDLFPKDRVEVILKGDHVLSVRLIERQFKKILGRFKYDPKKITRGWVSFQKKKHKEMLYIPSPPPEVKENDFVYVEVNEKTHPQFGTMGTILKIFGDSVPASEDIQIIAGEYNLTEIHSETAVIQAQNYGDKIKDTDIKSRKDLRELPLITIDGETARDFDDAIYVEKKSDGFILWVAIADVAHYVTEDSPLDREAKSRSTSIYFPERAFHMLPRELSENLCSLKPNVDRLSLVCEMHFDIHGKKKNIIVYNAVINSKRRATYTEIQNEFNTQKEGFPYKAHFELYRLFKKLRIERGTIDFNLPEPKILVDKNGEPTEIIMQERFDAHKLIEEFMIIANESVTEWMKEKDHPFIYRVHETPSPESIKDFIKLSKHAGVDIKWKDAEITPKLISEIAKQIEKHPAELLLNTALLRSMRQAIYSADYGAHFGLASKAYTHFTSPIRRYPDLIVHRLIKDILKEEKNFQYQKKQKDELQKKLKEITEHCSFKERIANEAERDSHKLKQVRIMLKQLGNEFSGTIIGMIEKGFFVQLKDPYCEGYVSCESLQDDYYSFNEDKMMFTGKRKRRLFKIGDTVKITVSRADLESRKIDFVLTEFFANDTNQKEAKTTSVDSVRYS